MTSKKIRTFDVVNKELGIQHIKLIALTGTTIFSTQKVFLPLFNSNPDGFIAILPVMLLIDFIILFLLFDYLRELIRLMDEQKRAMNNL